MTTSPLSTTKAPLLTLDEALSAGCWPRSAAAGDRDRAARHLRRARPCAGGGSQLGTRRAAGRQHLDGRLRAALRRRSGRRRAAACEPAHPGRRGRRAAGRRHRGAHLHRRADPRRRGCRRDAGAMRRARRRRRAHRRRARAGPVDPPPRRRRAAGAVVLRGRYAPDAAGARPGGFGRRGAPAVAAPAARRAVLDRRRIGDAGRATQARRYLQLQPLHAARAASGRRLRGSRPGHRARPARRDPRRAARGALSATT